MRLQHRSYDWRIEIFKAMDGLTFTRRDMKKKKSKKGQTKYNKQWIAEHKRHRARLWHGDIDKLTGERIK